VSGIGRCAHLKSGHITPILDGDALVTDEKTPLPRRTYVLPEGTKEARVHESPSAESPHVFTLEQKQKFHIFETIEGEDGPWVKVCDLEGKYGYITGTTPVFELTKSRFMVERVAFISIVGVLGGIPLGLYTELGAFGIPVVILAMVVIYVFTKMVVGIGGFYEEVPHGPGVPGFDWIRLLLEPLYFVGLFITFMLIGLVYSCVRSTWS